MSSSAFNNVGTEREFADRRLKAMIESMVRAGCSEREIVTAVLEATGEARPHTVDPLDYLTRLWRWAAGTRP